jgi:hypothetical protein
MRLDRLASAPAFFGAVLLRATLISGAAPAQTRFVDPQTLPPGARGYALYGNLGNRDPFGYPASSGCVWSRIQVPTSQGLRWMAMEECNPGMMR